MYMFFVSEFKVGYNRNCNPDPANLVIWSPELEFSEIILSLISAYHYFSENEEIVTRQILRVSLSTPDQLPLVTGVGGTEWLTGLRGIAALIVTFEHFFEGDFDAGFRGYLADPPEENRHFFQLPPIRIIFAGQGMVVLFFIVSAYSISIRPLFLRDNAPREKFLDSLASSTFRRGIRLYIPVFTIEAISHLAMILGMYHWQGHSTSAALSIWGHIFALLAYMMDAIIPLTPSTSLPLNGQLWTIPAEFLGSNLVYLTILSTANLRPIMKLATIASAGLVGFWNLHWTVFTFMSGLAIAEVHALREVQRSAAAITGKEKRLGRFPKMLTACNSALFIIGIYLLCLPEQPIEDCFSWEYRFLLSLWGDHAEEKEDIAQIWRSVGGLFCVFAISNSVKLQAILETKVAQYLGRISFGVYLAHLMIYQMWRGPLLSFFERSNAFNSTASLWFSWVATFSILLPVVLWTGHKLTSMVDKKSVHIAKWIEARLSY
ncbi:acyltransferase family-domain-containing protein [Phaeosphaeriaceae sp. PMI808]|nr:acyltransferase family-domain-containing protein [Phaeosphaeriaceae sp. PMI808]